MPENTSMVQDKIQAGVQHSEKNHSCYSVKEREERTRGYFLTIPKNPQKCEGHKIQGKEVRKGHFSGKRPFEVNSQSLPLSYLNSSNVCCEKRLYVKTEAVNIPT